jgi:hypothetical protein
MPGLFCNVGPRSFVVTKIDVEQQHLWNKTYTLTESGTALDPLDRCGLAQPNLIKAVADQAAIAVTRPVSSHRFESGQYSGVRQGNGRVI